MVDPDGIVTEAARALNAQLHILIVSPGFPANEADDTCIPALQEYLRAFVTAYPGVRVTVIALHYPFTTVPYRWHGIDVLPLGATNSLLKKPFLWYRAIRHARSVHRAHPANVVHSFWLGESAVVGSFAADRIGALHVCTLMGQELRHMNRYASFLRNGPTRFFALSAFQEKEFERRMGRRSDGIIPWGVDAAAAAGPEPSRDASGREIDLLGAGSLIAVKNFRLFIQTAAAIARKRPTLRCVIAGEGPDRPAIEALIRENGLEKSVTLTGMIPRREVLALMRTSKILLHPSEYEGFGYVFAEALACDMEIVSFDVGAARPSPRWQVARSEEELISCTERALDAPSGLSPLRLFPVEETVVRYAAVYGIDAHGGTR